MHHTALASCSLIVLLVVPAQRQTVARQALPMLEAEACSIKLTDATRFVDFGGRVAAYRATVKNDGAVSSLELVERNFAQLMSLDGLEDCVRRWRFGNAGVYTVTVTGGTRAEPAIQVVQGQRSFRLRLQCHDNRPIQTVITPAPRIKDEPLAVQQLPEQLPARRDVLPKKTAPVHQQPFGLAPNLHSTLVARSAGPASSAFSSATVVLCVRSRSRIAVSNVSGASPAATAAFRCASSFSAFFSVAVSRACFAATSSAGPPSYATAWAEASRTARGRLCRIAA
jgi:hypothetical protein